MLFPRLSSTAASERMEQFANVEIALVASQADEGLADLPITAAAAGGARVADDAVLALRDTIREYAREAGYPKNHPDRIQQQQFDLKTALLLRSVAGLDAGEAIRAETWQYFAAGLLPDVVCWRFPPKQEKKSVTEARYLGGNRNCFGRLWQRAAVFWDERLDDETVLLKNLNEDNFVAILERSAFATQPRQCREVARAFLLRRHLVENGGFESPAETLLRDAMRRMVRKAGYVALWALDEGELLTQTASVFDASLNALGCAPVPETELLKMTPQLVLTP